LLPPEVEAAAETAYAVGPASPATIPVIAAATAIRPSFDRPSFDRPGFDRPGFDPEPPSPVTADVVTGSAPGLAGEDAGSSADEDRAAADADDEPSGADPAVAEAA
jgi:hypothetical protein